MSLVPSCTALAGRLFPGTPRPAVPHWPGTSPRRAGARQLALEEKMMAVVAEAGCLPAPRGQELPLALWVDAPIRPPTPGDKVSAAALLLAGSRQCGGVACCTGCQRAGLEKHQGQATARCPVGAQGPAPAARELGPVAPAELAQIWGRAGCCRELYGDDSAQPGASSCGKAACLG